MIRQFRNLSIALKLNLVQGALMLAVIVVATLWTATHLRQQLEAKALQELRQTNRLVVSMFETYDRGLRGDIERGGRVFAGLFDSQLELVAKAGEAPRLMQRGVALNDRLEVVDAFTARSGTLATIFVRQGDDFLRTATSVKKEDGSRATGTPLGAGHPALADLLAGKPYTGKATLFGKEYMTHYLPARDAGGQVVGAFFVGLDLSEGLKALKQSVLAIKVGESGYVYALDAGAQKGRLTVHPAKEGANLLGAKDSRGFEFVVEMLAKKSGVVLYDWANPGETAPRQKIVVYEHLPAWDWVVASGSYLAEFSREANAVVLDLVVMALIIIIAAALSCIVFANLWVTRPLREVMAEADRIAAGDLTGNLRADSTDEVGRLKTVIGTMAEHLKATIGDVRRASGTMLDQSLALVASAEQVAKSSHAQSDAATGMAASVEEMSVSIDQVAQHAREAQRISSGSGATASQGGAVIEEAVGAMGRIANSVREVSVTVGDLGDRSKEISAVVQVIREIADQTNLLALNAAIEAARAGEAGRGFAVVADEVRLLAERTAKSTRSIGEMIAGIQDSAKAAVGRMQDGVAEVEHGSALADRAGQAIGEINVSTRDVIGAVGSISDAISEQNVASQTIAQGVEQIAQMAEANHAASQSTAQSAQALRELATKLDEALARFRVA